jgi:hypothetical protein
MMPLFAQGSKPLSFFKDLAEKNGWVVAVVVLVLLAVPAVAAAVVGHRFGKKASSEDQAIGLGALAGAVTGLFVLFLPVAVFCLVRGEDVLAKGPLSAGALAAFLGFVSGGRYGKSGWKATHSTQEARPENSSAAELEKLKERVAELENQMGHEK